MKEKLFDRLLAEAAANLPPLTREEKWRLVRQATPEEQRALMAYSTRKFEELQAVNAQQKARFDKAVQKATVSREVSHHNPLPSTQDRVRDAIARATQERARDVMKAREYAASMRDPLHQRSVARPSPTNGLPPMDKSREPVQDSQPKKVDIDRD